MHGMRWLKPASLLFAVLMLTAAYAASVGATSDTTLQSAYGESRVQGGQVFTPAGDDERARWEAMEVAGVQGSDRHPQVVIGPDAREQVTDTTAFPYRAVAQIEIYDESLDEGWIRICTATFIGSDVLLTAAHCLYDPASDGLGGWADEVLVIPGRDGLDDEPFGNAWASQMWVPNGYIQDSSIENPYDYALLTLGSSDLGATVGQLQIGVLSTDTLSSNTFNPTTSGYPGDKTDGTQWRGSEPAFSSVNDTYLEHEIDSFKGQSGSAVWRGSDLAIVGVESFEYYGGYEMNVAVRINEAVLADLLGACDTLGCSFGYFVEGGPEPEPTPTPTPTPDPSVPAAPRGDLAAFERTWARTDLPVRDGAVSRTWMWGPQPFTDYVNEPYADAPDGYRTVFYHEKSRMEITQPGGDAGSFWYVSNGLIAKELVTGQLQVGDDDFEHYGPALINVAGDPDDPSGPTYASFIGLQYVPPNALNAAVMATVDRDGSVGSDAGLLVHGVTIAEFVPETNHGVASVFWSFMNSQGTVYENGGFASAALFPNPYYATGYPITEPYWATVEVGGVARWVLIQVFERRVLTYTPGNPPGWDVEAGNVGLHYHTWRYELIDGDTPPADVVPEAGAVLDSYDLTQGMATGEVAPGVDASVGDGGYNLAMQSENLYIVYAGDNPLTEASISVDVRVAQGSALSVGCVVGRMTLEPLQNYEFCLTSTGRFAAAYISPSGDSTILMEPTDPYYLDGWTTLEIRVRGDRFWFLANGTLVGSAEHIGPTAGFGGFQMTNLEDGPSEWGFRNLVLRALE